MNWLEKKRELTRMAQEAILPLIESDYVLYGLPYYRNIGDILIWNGELELLKKTGFSCVGVCGWNKYPDTPARSGTTILITGGGFWGDLWRDTWEYALKGIAHNRNNRIIILPQTIYYQDKELMRRDADYLSRFPNLVICVRDNMSYKLARDHFSNPVVLVPDMAFCVNEEVLIRHSLISPSKEVLYLRRSDKEFDHTFQGAIPPEADCHDWLSIEHEQPEENMFKRIYPHVMRVCRHLSPNRTDRLHHYLYGTLYRTAMTRIALRQLTQYREIYSTRLHVMILGMLLGRKIKFIDSRYGKLSTFYDTWLTDCDNVEPLIPTPTPGSCR